MIGSVLLPKKGPSVDNEAQLVAKALEGDRRALGELLLAHQGAAFGYALSVAGDASDAEDAVQEAFALAVSSTALRLSSKAPPVSAQAALRLPKDRPVELLAHGFLPSRRLISRSKSEMYSASCRLR
jgi:hypothetical protein